MLGGRSIDCACFFPSDCRRSSEHSARCVNTSKTSTEHATAVVGDVRGHFNRGKEQDVNRPQEPSLPLHVENHGILPKAAVELMYNMYPLSNQALRDPCRCTNGQSNNLVRELDNTHENCNCGSSTDFCTVHPKKTAPVTVA